MLELKSISMRNFWSYGDFETSINLDDLGSCLITGQVSKPDAYDDGSFAAGKDSNGAGKSALVQGMLWCLFGRTMRIPNPGDKVINWYTKKDCYVELTFKNGDTLKRTRKLDGHSDLLFIKDNEDISLGTTTMEQNRLNKLLDLDWETFCGSTFFAQFGKSWMELSDIKRKDALEREFHMDKIQLYADSAKERVDKAKAKQANLNAKISGVESAVYSIEEDIKRLTDASEQFGKIKEDKVAAAEAKVIAAIELADSVPIPDIESIERKWGLYGKIQDKLTNKRSKLLSLSRDRAKIEGSVRHEKGLIKRWRGKGDMCGECEQPIPESHIAQKVANPEENLKQYSEELENLNKEIETRTTTVDAAETLVETKKPKITKREAQSAIRESERLQSQIIERRKVVEDAKAEQDHYAGMIVASREKLATKRKEATELKSRVAKIDRLLLHLNYIYRAYHDRRRIKSYMLAEYIPYLNERIKHYLDRFGLDISIEFTNALGIKSDKWGYKSLSGGESKRFDVAMMLAMFDLHVLMYGRYCNIIVFDEVDGRLDSSGTEIFADLLRNEFSEKVDTILVISQRLDMRGTLQSEIRIAKEDGCSRVAEILK